MARSLPTRLQEFVGEWDLNIRGATHGIIKIFADGDRLRIEHPLNRGPPYNIGHEFIGLDGRLRFLDYVGMMVGDSISWEKPGSRESILWTRHSPPEVRVGRSWRGGADVVGGAARVGDAAAAAAMPAGSGRRELGARGGALPLHVSREAATAEGLAAAGEALPLLITREAMAGLHVEEWRAEAPPEDHRRDHVRQGTKRKVAQELGLSRWGDPASSARKSTSYAHHITLYKDIGPNASSGRFGAAGGPNLLARFDVVAVPALADYDAAWNALHGKRRNPFYVLHAAALNVGESSDTATDFCDYCTRGSAGELDVERYLNDMGQIFDNILFAAKDLKVKHVIWFPFGMGAFMRHLERLDPKFTGNPATNLASVTLRRSLCQRFAKAIAAAAAPHPAFHVHLCLAPTGDGSEADANVDAFIRAVQGLPAGLLTVCLYADSLQVAHELAGKGDEMVAVVNGANRTMMGNHWFGGGARHAIDENLHRRSWLLAAHSYLLNDFGSAPKAPLAADTLDNRVKKLGGAVKTMGGSSGGAPTASRRPPSASRRAPSASRRAPVHMF